MKISDRHDFVKTLDNYTQNVHTWLNKNILSKYYEQSYLSGTSVTVIIPHNSYSTSINLIPEKLTKHNFHFPTKLLMFDIDLALKCSPRQ